MPRPAAAVLARLALLGGLPVRGLGLGLQPRTQLADAREPFKVTWRPEDESISSEESRAEVRAGSTLSFSNGTSCLTFLHIPKTGGTFVEQTESKVGGPSHQSWGREDRNLSCHGMHDAAPYWETRSARRACPMKDGSACSVWHVPPSLDQRLDRSYKDGGCETFCVVREPAARFRSQHAWLSRLLGGDGCTSESLNRAVDEKLEGLKKTPYMDDCHLVPQAVFYNSGRDCQHVIRHEHFREQFPELLGRFGIEVEIKEEDSNPTHCQAGFSRQATEKLHQYYSEDYAQFGFPKLLPEE